MDYRIISIGALSINDLWDKQGPARTAHSTTTLIRSGKKTILVDPALPPQVLVPRLAERSGLTPEDITDVFLTCYRPGHRYGLAAFSNANWYISEAEREVVGRELLSRFEQEEGDEEVRDLLKQEIEVLQRCKAAPDTLADQVDLFPSFGFTPGTCGLLLSHSRSTTVIAGDAAPTIEHIEHGRVLKDCFDVEQAQASLKEILEVADEIVPGHDNAVVNPMRGPF
ncbi:MAG: MBL fold metallo-hydrolase [Phycisphaeraceae bacterium]|nr:MBL fold metallo-hydrolase [Phycisphaeraceae bacterium]